MVEIAQSYNGVSGSTDSTIAYLLHLYQVTEQRNQWTIGAQDEVEETVISELSRVVNGDKDSAKEWLRRFNDIVRTCRLRIYASDDQ
jgi:hypothetical protein